MADIAKVKEVRERSGAGVSDCGKALQESNGDVDAALEILQKKGILKAGARSARIAAEGVVYSYVHSDRVGVLIEVNCETDFTARSQEFRQFVEEMSLQIAAMNPKWVGVDEIPKDAVDKQVEIYTEQLRAEGKPEKAWAKIAAGKLGKWYTETCLLEQESIIHSKQPVESLRAALVAKTGENIKIRRFVRWEVGEGIEKTTKEDYALEVARMTVGS